MTTKQLPPISKELAEKILKHLREYKIKDVFIAELKIVVSKQDCQRILRSKE
jgi:hypothetical protein